VNIKTLCNDKDASFASPTTTLPVFSGRNTS